MKNKLIVLGYIVNYTTQLCWDYIKPLQGSLLNNQYNGKYGLFFFVAHFSQCTQILETPLMLERSWA